MPHSEGVCRPPSPSGRWDSGKQQRLEQDQSFLVAAGLPQPSCPGVCMDTGTGAQTRRSTQGCSCDRGRWSAVTECLGPSRCCPTLRSSGSDKEFLAAGWNLLLLPMVLLGRGCRPPPTLLVPLRARGSKHSCTGDIRTEPGPRSGVAGGKGDRASSILRQVAQFGPGRDDWGLLCPG